MVYKPTDLFIHVKKVDVIDTVQHILHEYSHTRAFILQRDYRD